MKSLKEWVFVVKPLNLSSWVREIGCALRGKVGNVISFDVAAITCL